MPVTPSQFLTRATVAVSLANGPITSGAISNFLLPPLDLTEALGGAHLNNEANDVRVADSDLADVNYYQYRDAASSGDTVRGLSNFWLIGNPNTAGVRSGDYLYYTRALVDGKVLLCQRHLNTHKIVTKVLVSTWALSDHNTGAVFDRDNDGRIAVIASEHSNNGFIANRMTRAHDMDSFGSNIDLKTAMGLPADSSYAQVFFSPLFPGRTFCMFRNASPTWNRQISYSDSADLSVWSTPVSVIDANGVASDRPYPVIIYDDATNRLYILFSRDNPEDTTPGGGDPNNTPLYAGYIQFAAGAQTNWTVRTMAGTSLGAFGTGILNLTNATNAWQVADRVAWPWHAFMCNGQPAFIIGSTEGTDIRIQEMRVLRWNGSAFVATTLAETVTTAAFDYYPAGACSADNGLTIYACTASNGALPGLATQRVVKYVTADNWATSPTPIEVERHGGKTVRFVWVPKNADARCPWVADSGYYDRITQIQETSGRGQMQVFGGRKGIVVAPIIPSLPVNGNVAVDVYAGRSGLAAGETSNPLLFDWCAPSVGRHNMTPAAATFFQNLAAFSVECIVDIQAFGAGTTHYLFSGWPSSGNLGGPMIRYNSSQQLEVVTVIGTTTTTTTQTNLLRPVAGRHHIVLNYSAATGIKVYQNNVVGSATQAIASNYLTTGTIVTPLCALWSIHAAPDTQTFGRMVMCRIRNRVLTTDEIAATWHLATAPGAIRVMGRNSFGNTRPIFPV